MRTKAAPLLASILAAFGTSFVFGQRIDRVSVSLGTEFEVPESVPDRTLAQAALFDRAEGGSPLWISASFPLSVVQGSARLDGRNFPALLDASVAKNSNLFLELIVGGKTLARRIPVQATLAEKSRRIEPLGPGGLVAAEGFPIRSFSMTIASRPEAPAPFIPARRAEPSPPPPGPPPLRAVNPDFESPRATPRLFAADRESQSADALYFEALRDYAMGSGAQAVPKLWRAVLLAPENDEIRLALDRVRRESTEPLADRAHAPSAQDLHVSEELYFQALSRYAHGDIAGSRESLQSAWKRNPSDTSLSFALRHLDQEPARRDR